LPTLQGDIDAESIPKRWGGELEWSHGMLPNLKREVKESLQWREEQKFPVGPVKWKDEGEGLVACLTGSQNGSLRSEKVGKVDRGKAAEAAVASGGDKS
jgi:hypothetical protein